MPSSLHVSLLIINLVFQVAMSRFEQDSSLDYDKLDYNLKIVKDR